MLVPFILATLVHFSLAEIFFGAYPVLKLFPEITFRAYTPNGLEITILKSASVPEIVKFEYSKNYGERYVANMNSLETSQEWRFFDPKIKLEIGNSINYTISIISNKFDPLRQLDSSFKFTRYFRIPIHRYPYTETQLWNVTALDSLCEANHLPLAEIPNCNNYAPIFEDNFSGEALNRELWSVEQYIPLYSEENYEFVSYQDDNECVFLSDSKLYLKPVVVSNKVLHDTLDLRSRCSRNTTHSCFYRQIGPNYLPVVKSGKIVSNFEFKHGKVEIRAKLPVGDSIFPLIELIPSDLRKKHPKFLIAYSRGNKVLTTKEGWEIGSNTLFGGYLHSTEEMSQSGNLMSIKLFKSLGEDMNVFTLTWTSNKIILGVNNDTYGTTYRLINDENYKIALGVGVGGNVDFPDDAVSGTYKKPWENNAAKQVKNFVEAKDLWINSWVGNNVALQVDYIKVFPV